ncbi:MAG: hypothetical protein NVS3B1_07750 [Marmoricola sp.]
MARPYQGATVSDLFRFYWGVGGVQQGPGAGQPLERFYGGRARAKQIVFIRRGSFVRSFHPRGIEPGYAGEYGQPGGQNGIPYWYPDWTPDPANPWEIIPSIKQVRLNQDFTNNGITTASIDIDNIVYTEQNKGLGIYHMIDRGFYSPLRGYTTPGQPQDNQPANEWLLKMPNAQVMVYQGYGTELVPTFTGLIDDIDLDASPSVITVTCRDFAGVLSDEHFFGWAQDKRIDQITFVPSKGKVHGFLPGAGGTPGRPGSPGSLSNVGGAPTASSEEPQHPAREVGIVGNSKWWESTEHTQPNTTEWVEIRLPKCSITGFYVSPKWAGMDIYLGVYLEPVNDGAPHSYHCHWTPNGATAPVILDESQMIVENYDDGIPYGFWSMRNGLVQPGDPNGQWPWIMKFPAMGAGGHDIPLGGTLRVGDGTRLRIGVRNLARRSENGLTKYRAGIARLVGRKGTQPTQGTPGVPAPHGPEIIAQIPTDLPNEIPIDDVTDIAKILFRWAGFKEWEVESSGLKLADPIILNPGDSFMTLLTQLRDQLGYTFFMGEPTGMESLGVPVFRYSRVFENTQTQVDRVSDQDLLTHTKIKWTNQQERTVIRVRGAITAGGVPLGADSDRRVMFVYLPPWIGRMAGVLKPLTIYNDKLTTTVDCQVGCYIVALQIALSMVTGIIQLPGTPHLGLDSFVSVRDKQVGINGRLYITNRTSTFTSGEDAEYVSEFGGSFVDTPDILRLVADWIGSKVLDRNDR